MVGHAKFLYDLWGDTVNVAARITDQAAPGTVCASLEIWQPLSDRGVAIQLGAVEIKGKGALELVQISELF